MFAFPLSPNSFTPFTTAFKSFHSTALKIVGSTYTCKGSWIGNLRVTLNTQQNSSLAVFPKDKLSVKIRYEIVIYTEYVCYRQITIQNKPQKNTVIFQKVIMIARLNIDKVSFST